MKDSGSQVNKNRAQRATKLIIFSILMVLTSGLLLIVSGTPLFHFDPFDSPAVNQVLNYQLSALPMVSLALLLTFLFAGNVRLGYLSPNRRGTMEPVFGRFGGGRWESDALPIALIMVAIVAVAAFFQVLPSGFSFHWVYIVLTIPFAAMNAFTEEVIFRLPYVTMSANDTSSGVYGLAMGSIVFGGFHVWGVVPNGILGGAMSGILGFFLAKSIYETKGFFWAFTIHFMLNIATMLFVLNQAF